MNELRFRYATPVKFAAIALLTLIVLLPGATRAGEYEYRLSLSASAVSFDNQGNPRIIVNSADRFLDTWDEGLPVVPYRIVSVLLPQGEEFEFFEVKTGPHTVVAKAFRPVLQNGSFAPGAGYSAS